MKKITFIILAILSLLFTSSCKKDENKTWEKSMLIGSWEQTSGTDFVQCPNGNNAKIKFTESDYTEYSTYDDGCVTDFGLSSTYTFDGKEIVLVNAVSYIITELSATSLSYKIEVDNITIGNATYVKM
jgi:hypothetical protein